MPHFYDSFPSNLQAWALQQSIFFTASAPLKGRHINLSPKGRPAATFAIFNPNQAGYLDFSGSGAETISHIYENGRVTVMFCSFDGQPRILRLFCTGRVVEWDMAGFEDAIKSMGKEKIAGTRAVIVLDIWKVQTSCGYGVPILGTVSDTTEATDAEVEKNRTITRAPCQCWEERYTLEKWLVNKEKKKTLGDYQVKLNSRSLDGLLGLRVARKMRGEWVLAYEVKAKLTRLFWHPEALCLGVPANSTGATLTIQLDSFARAGGSHIVPLGQPQHYGTPRVRDSNHFHTHMDLPKNPPLIDGREPEAFAFRLPPNGDEALIGRHRRKLCSDIDVQDGGPCSGVVVVEVGFVDSKGRRRSFWGSGTVIDDQHIMTVGHNIWHRKHGRAVSASVYRDSRADRYGSDDRHVDIVAVHSQWIHARSVQNDFAILRISEPFHDNVRPLRYHKTPTDIDSISVKVYGFKDDKPKDGHGTGPLRLAYSDSEVIYRPGGDNLAGSEESSLVQRRW
ncbi:hypothetical protein F5B20DRAFT_592783 [Whalleya microplaca]|nr:hypothetical protein F5B20DRAFT_592783 [Whalleya microplaca]